MLLRNLKQKRGLEGWIGIQPLFSLLCCLIHQANKQARYEDSQASLKGNAHFTKMPLPPALHSRQESNFRHSFFGLWPYTFQASFLKHNFCWEGWLLPGSQPSHSGMKSLIKLFPLKIMFKEDLTLEDEKGKRMGKGKTFVCSNLFNLHNNSMFLSYRWGKWSTETWSNMPKVTERCMSRWSAHSEDWAPIVQCENNKYLGGGKEEIGRGSKEMGGHPNQPHLYKDSV